MAHDQQRSLFSSLFGSKQNVRTEDPLELESRRKLEQRIEQALADMVMGLPAPEHA